MDATLPILSVSRLTPRMAASRTEKMGADNASPSSTRKPMAGSDGVLRRDPKDVIQPGEP